jgi:hypothetical protein
MDYQDELMVLRDHRTSETVPGAQAEPWATSQEEASRAPNQAMNPVAAATRRPRVMASVIQFTGPESVRAL